MNSIKLEIMLKIGREVKGIVRSKIIPPNPSSVSYADTFSHKGRGVNLLM